MKDFTFLMKNTNLESAVWNDIEREAIEPHRLNADGMNEEQVRRASRSNPHCAGIELLKARSTDGQSQRQYSVGTIARPLPDSVSNPCRVRDLATPWVFSAVLSARAWKHVAMIFAVLVMSMANVGMAWGADITVTPYAPTNITSIPYGLFTLSHSSTASSSKISSGAITTGSNDDVITIHFETTKSDIYIKSITFNSLSNGTLSSSDGTISSSTFTASSAKNAVDIVLTSASGKKGTVKITDVVIDPGTNDIETITFTSASAGTVSFTSSAATSALTSLTSNGTHSVSSNILTWANSKTLVFTSSRKLTYIALQRNDGKNDSFTSSPTGMSDFAWSGNSNTVTFTNSAGGGRPFAKAYIIAAPACAAADLAAADITSNGDQIVGTGITFSKVGSPASGDTWYWQTSATGTDKTYNASSSYTTATTAGSYTVYLRAYNSAADCWGKAIGKTNTIISCPFDVYNGENVDKGNATASGWTINSSTNMTKTSGSSNGYSYWYQAGSASSYVQFDGSMALVSGDKIKIQWTHTNGSNKTLQLTINGSSASLTSGSQANSSTLVEAVYDVTSTTTVTSIKLNSSGSSGCIIYQVSIVKAVCAEPSCSDETGLAYGTGTVNKVYGDAVFTNTLTNPNSLGVTYSSTNTSVATVNSSTGAVTIAGAGTTTIKATWAGNATYCADEVSYTLNVKPNAGSVTGDWDRFGGETIDLSVSPTGGSSYTYQWQKWYNSQWNNISNGADGTATISGATTNNLQISTCHKDNSGSYRCQVTAGGQTNETDGHQVKVYVLECYNSGTTVYNFTRDGNNQRGSLTIDLAASTNYGFKVHADNDYYGNNGTVYEDVTNWVCSTDQAGNLTIAAGLGGTFTITMDYSASVGAAAEGIPEVTVTYPRKRIYLEPNSDWLSNSAKFAYYYYRKVGETTYGTGWTDFLTANDCGMSAEIPQWSGVQMIAVRFNSTKASTGNWDDKWNQTSDLTVTANDLITITGWDNSQTYTTYSIPTYTISYAGNGNTSGSMSNVSSIPCGEDRTLVTNAFVKTDNIFEGWKANVDVTIGGANVTAGTLISDGATIQNIHSDITLTAQWTACSGPSITAEAGMAGQTYTVGAAATAITVTASAGNGGTLHYHWYQYNVGQNPLTQSIDAVGGTDANTYTPSTASAHEGQIFYCVVSEEGCSTTVQSAYSGAITVNGVVDPCSEPSKVANEIARFFVPCGLSNATSDSPTAWTVTNEDASTGDNTFATSGFGGGSSNWYRNETSGLIYGKLTSNSSYITIKLKSGNFQAGDVITAYFNRNNATKTGLTLHTQGSTYAIDPASTAAEVETSGTYTLEADAIEADGSIILFRANSSTYVNRIIVTRAPVGASITATKTSPDYVTTDPGNVQLSISTTGASSGWYYRVKNTGNGGYQTPDNTPYNTATWTMTSGLALGANNFVVELYNGSGVKQAESGTITVTAETAYPITIAAGAGGSVSPSGEIKANESGNHIHPTITATPSSGYHFVNWTLSNANATVADASSATTTISNAVGACTITANFEEDAVLTLTAIEADVLYQAQDMANVTFTTDTWFTGLSTNSRFETYGNGSSNSAKGTSISSTNVTDDISTKSFTSKLYIMTADNRDNTSDPTHGAIEFITPSSAGVLYVYLEQTNSGLTLKKKGTSTSTSLSGANYKVMVVDANAHYFINGAGSNRGLYGIKYVSTYSVSITPTNVTKVTGATGATAAIPGKAYTATFTANVGYTLPSDATVTIGGTPQTKGSGYTWTISEGTATLTIPAANVTGNITIAVTGDLAPTYSITYNCNGAESGCPSNVAAATNLPNPLPSAPTKDGYDFGGWFTDSDCTVAAVAGAALTANTTLYAKWTEHIASECITVTDFATSNTSCSNNIPDNNSKYFYGYKGTVDAAHAVTITSNDGNDHGQNSGVEMRLTYNKKARIYANNTTNATPTGFENVVSVSFKWKFIASGNSGNTELTSSYTVKVGSTTIANAVPITGKTNDGYATVTIDNLAQLNGYIEFLFGGSSSSYNVYLDDIEICTADMASCTTPTLPTATLNDQALCEGADIATWTATPTNASTITGKGESISYSWKKKGSETVLGTGATFDLGNSATESQAGTYVVTVTVSKAGYTSATVSEEIELGVTESTEVTSITADKATVYEGNSVTLTATANTTVTWQWYTCTNAAGDGESSIGGATSAAYAIASAPAAGTHYYKVKATSSCGTASLVYALVVSEASGGDCETEIWVVKAADLPEGTTAATHITTPFSGGSNESASITIDGNTYTITQRTSNATGPATIVVPEGNTATLYILVKGNGGRSVILEKGGVQQWTETPEDGWQALSVDNLAAGTYSLRSSNNLGWGLLALKLCSASACSDPEVTASADNTTACVETSVTFTAANAHALATYQWQKLDGTWTNISGATVSTYNIPSVVAGDAGKYRVIATHDCNRTSNEVTLSVPSAPDFGSTVPASVSVMQTIALSINTVEATDAVKYRWYKSADATWDAGDVEIGTNKELIKAYDSEAIGSPSYYIFCRAQNACGITTSTAIAVNVTTYVEEDCATRGNESDAAFSFENSGAGQGSYESTACWTMNSNSKILVYYPPTGKYFKTAKVTIASSSESKASYNWSTNGGTSFTAVSLTVNSTLTERTINLSAHGNVDAFQIGRNFDGKGSSSGTLYVSKICFEYTDACTATTVTPSTASTSYEMGGAWTNPTFTLAPAAVSGETLTYSSSNEDIASVDDDGTVTFNGDAGIVTITAAYAGGEVSSTQYCASEGSYTINVSCPGGAPKVVPAAETNMSGCNSSITLHAKQSDGISDFADGTYQWFRNGTEIDGATSSSYTATQAGIYTVERTNPSGCTTPSTNSAVVTSETTEPEVERLVPFQYYHVDKTYSDQMKMRHLFAVKNSGKLDGKSFKMYVSRSGGAATDVTSSNALVVWPNGDGHVDTVMVDLNKLSGKYSENDELVFTCKAIDCSGNVSDVYKETITMRVIGATPTLALICSGSSKAGGTRKTGELTVGGDFLTGYNVADLCQQTGNTSFDANTEWGLYTDLKTQYIVTPVNGYAVFNKLNYEPFDILLLTDYPKASKSDAAKDVLDDMAALCDYRPMLSFKTHMVAKSPSKWAEKGFTTSPVVTKADGRLNLNIVCYAHPMFEGLKSGEDVYEDANNTSAPLVYTMLSETGYESSKGMQGFELAAAENFVTIGLTHYNGTITKNSPLTGEAEWTPGSEDRMLVTVAERQTNIEARFILFSLNCGAQSKLTERGEQVILACLEYLLDDDPLHVADCSFTFDNGASNEHDAAWYSEHCNTCTGTKGDGKWTTAANWGPDYRLLPGEFTSVRIKKPVEVNDEHAHVMEVRIIDEGRIDIPAGKALDVKSTIRRMDGTEIYPTEENDIHIGSSASGNGTLIFNNNDGDTKARVDMYSTAKADTENYSAAASTWQYIGTPHNDVAIATYNYYDSWLYQYDTGSEGWIVIPNGGPLVPFRGYCVTHPETNHTFVMDGTLAATGTVDIDIPAGKYVVVANSWTAPIDINKLADDDLENITDKSIYFFNTGSDSEGNGVTGTAAGTYRTTPIHAAVYTGDWQIPSMQGFYVVGGSSDGTLHLDYNRHVRPADARTIVNNPMYAPSRAKVADEEPTVLKIFARGNRYQDKLVVLEREDFTRGYDSGWDGEAWGGSDLSPMMYVIGEGRMDAVSAIPDMDGTVIGFRAGEDDIYTFHFEYDGYDEPLYLLDTDTKIFTRVVTGNIYTFMCTDKRESNRFLLTRKNAQDAPTDNANIRDEYSKPLKFLNNDKIYIYVRGVLYDITGKVVK